MNVWICFCVVVRCYSRFPSFFSTVLHWNMSISDTQSLFIILSRCRFLSSWLLCLLWWFFALLWWKSLPPLTGSLWRRTGSLQHLAPVSVSTLWSSCLSMWWVKIKAPSFTSLKGGLLACLTAKQIMASYPGITEYLSVWNMHVGVFSRYSDFLQQFKNIQD